MTKEESLARPLPFALGISFEIKVDWSVPFCAPTFFPLKLLTLTSLSLSPLLIKK